jgi:hypothetical protein
MKKLALFILVSIFALGFFYQKEVKNFGSFLKKEALNSFPFLEKFLGLKNVVKEPHGSFNPQKIGVKKNFSQNHFLNQEVFFALCEKEPQEKLQEPFQGCEACPISLRSRKNFSEEFRYIFETRGNISNQNRAKEAIIFLKGCSQQQENGVAVLLEESYGGWRKTGVFDGILFDVPPLEFLVDEKLETQDNTIPFVVFVGKVTLKQGDLLKTELKSMHFKNKKWQQDLLWTAQRDLRQKCDRAFQSSLENPMKKQGNSLEIRLEVIPCENEKFRKKSNSFLNLGGSHNLRFDWSPVEEAFQPTLKTTKFLTQMEKALESDL